MATSFTLDDRAQSGFQNASDYDTHRPSYPTEAVDKLLTHLGVAGQKNAKIVDLACGTGKFTELLVKRPEGFEVVGVEPHEGMRAESVRKELKGVKVMDGDAGNMLIEEGWGDSLIAAQAFHWFATEESLKEIHRVLKPGATFGMIWNIEDYNAPKAWTSTTNWEQTLKDIIACLEDGHPRFRHMAWKQVFEKQLDSSTPLQTLKDTFTQNFPQFSLPLGEDDVKWTVWLTDEGVWSRYATLSQIANLKGEKLGAVRKQVADALKGDEVERNEKGEIAVHGVTHFVWTSRV